MGGSAIMLQGTGSSVGKSLLVAALSRAALRRGLRVLPFKPQNMSNNAAITADGGEIGRAQALQARAAGAVPCVHMNPVLLKPQSAGAQIIVQGKIVGNAAGREYQKIKASLMPQVLESFEYLRARADLVIVEGAGSASEINLRQNDIANMGFARATNTPVVLVGDIDRGGVIASLVGTKTVVDPADAALIQGFIVNRLRGDATLFDDGMRFIAARTGWAPLGLVPFFERANMLPAEDAADLAYATARGTGPIVVVVPMLPHIANFDDLDPLATEPAIQLRMIPRGMPLPPDAALVILPGSKATIADLNILREEGWDIDIAAHRRRGGMVLGLCGGYQLLGRTIADPEGIEGPRGSVAGLGMLDVTTNLTAHKTLEAAEGISIEDGIGFNGYEMHVGRTEGADTLRPFLQLTGGRLDGARSVDGRVVGTYVHGLFAHDAQRAAWVSRLGGVGLKRGPNYEALVETTLDALAAHFEAHVNVDVLLELAR